MILKNINNKKMPNTKKEWIKPTIKLIDLQEQLMLTESLNQGEDVPGGGGELNGTHTFLQNTIDYDTKLT